ncbi:LytR C-terminal domain-containing protein [Streptomyces sp. ID05-47C]|uniref:LytR C-terminal domain-containing protein n=1 Tax=Streptomyces sp. ID05-47C TaxID=3028665 RepID=UPI0029AA2BEE|nr:LytR C-terminal domain-containing protein [Streptomyces sp. ID05-47C]MDX3568244.1 LytR C-terminal domain-containing protein [Streptomyces sp. ID05-47C]
MNDRNDADYGEIPYELVGYDEYGQPVYRQVQPQQAYDPYGQQQGYGYDPYAQGGQQPPAYPAYDTGQQPPTRAYDPYDTGQQPATPAYDPYDTGRQAPVHDPYGTGTRGQQGAGTAAPYDPYGQTAAGGQQPRGAEQTAYIPQQAGPAEAEAVDEGTDASAGTRRDYHTEQFAFVEDPDGDSEDVIDWLNFTENRTERREEAKRRARGRLVALVVVLALTAAGGVGYLWYAGKLPGLSSSDDSRTGTTAAPAAQKRDVIVVHLHDTARGGTSTALLVDNTTTEQGTTVLLPNSLVVTTDDGTTTTLAKSVDGDGSAGTRESLDTVLGTEIQGTWRLDTPYLQNLVDLVGTIEVDTDIAVPDPAAKKKGQAPLVSKGEGQSLSGKMAVAYATYRAEGEAQNAQLKRFGQVMQAVLRKVSSDPQGATVTVQTLAQILDPSLTDKDLGAFLANLADLAKGGDFKTAMLPVQADGTLSAEASASVVKDVLGGTAKSPAKDAAVSVSVRNASGVRATTEDARVVLLNGGFTFLDGGTAGTASASKVLYADAADKENATDVAKTLGLPDDAVAKGTVPANADVTVVLGTDYERPSS